MRRAETAHAERRAGHAGHTLLELMLVLCVLGVLVGWGMPRFAAAVEQTRVDQAAAALRSVWLAERLHWLEHRSFTADLDALADARLVDQALLDQAEPFVFAIEAADEQTLSATAERTGSEAWSGLLDLDETGAIGGSTQHEDGTVVSPAP